MWAKIKKWLGFADLNKDGKVSAEDFELARAIAEKKFKEANEVINEVAVVAKEVKTRAKKVKTEVEGAVATVKKATGKKK